MKKGLISTLVIIAVTLLGGCTSALLETATPGAALIDYYGYTDCIALENENTRVILGPHCGGRVLEYAWKGTNSLRLDPQQAGWLYEPGKPTIKLEGGRFDIGPETVIPSHPNLWLGKWQAQITGPRSARMTSIADPATGVQLIREFKLDKNSSKLTCTQIIKNVSKQTKRYCHWSRTFLPGGGICLIPLSDYSRFPNKYISYQGRSPLINFKPSDPKITVRDGFLEMRPMPRYPKIGTDSYVGWLCYLTKDDMMFVKRFPTYPDRVYNEMTAMTVSVWYSKRNICELEPIGPMETIVPGKSASFTEQWWLLPYKFPGLEAKIDYNEVTKFVDVQAR